MRVGFGVDVHGFGGPGPLRLGGVTVDADRGLAATSDGDVAVHALIDALLGAAALGDLGTHYPSTDPRWEGVASLDLLDDTVARLGSAGHRIEHVDVTIVAESVKVGPHREQMRTTLAEHLGLDVDAVSVKATTTDRLGMIGRDEGIAAMAVVLIG